MEDARRQKEAVSSARNGAAPRSGMSGKPRGERGREAFIAVRRTLLHPLGWSRLRRHGRVGGVDTPAQQLDEGAPAKAQQAAASEASEIEVTVLNGTSTSARRNVATKSRARASSRRRHQQKIQLRRQRRQFKRGHRPEARKAQSRSASPTWNDERGMSVAAGANVAVTRRTMRGRGGSARRAVSSSPRPRHVAALPVAATTRDRWSRQVTFGPTGAARSRRPRVHRLHPNDDCRRPGRIRFRVTSRDPTVRS